MDAIAPRQAKRGLWLALSFTLSLTMAGGACGSQDDEAKGDFGEGPLYVAATWVSSDEITNTYVAVVGSIDVEEISLSAAIEVSGLGDAWVYDGAVFIADGERPTVTRYELSEDGRLEPGDAISFSGYGVSGAAFWDQQILSPTKAYLANASGLEYVVWNPSTMEITGTVPWPELDFDPGFAPFHSYTDRGGVVVDGLFFHGIYGHDETFSGFGDRSYVTVYDIETDELVDVIEVPCPMMDVASLGEDGYIYVSGWSYMPLSAVAGYTEKNCAARIDVETRTVDDGWLLDYAAVTGGEQGSALRVVEGNEGIFAVFHGTGVEVTPDIDIWDLDVGEDDWELYRVDLDTLEVQPTGVLCSDGSYYESRVDGRYYVYVGSGDDTQVYERTDEGYVKKLKMSGWMSRLFRLR